MLIFLLTAAFAQEAPLELTEAPTLATLAEAVYPPAAAEAGLEAEVRLLIEINEEGRVTRAEVIEPVGDGFDEAAQAALLESLFTPAQTETGPVTVVVEFTYRFSLAESAPAPPNLTGVVRQKGTRIPLAGVEVQVEAAESRYRTVTDEAGRWTLSGLPDGVATVRGVFPGHDDAKITVEVRPGERAEVQLWMRAESYAETVAVGLYSREEEVVVTRHSVSMEEARAVPGTLGDPLRVIQNLPGVARPGFGTGELIIRGANPEDSRVFIDGIEVPIVYHLGGYRSVIPAGMVAQIDYLPGSYPVRYGRGGGGVVDIHTTTPDSETWQLDWRTDILDSGAFATGKIGNVGIAVGARGSYLDAFLPLLTDSSAPSISPSWIDYQLKLSGRIGASRWSVFLFGLEDELEITVPEDFGDAEGFNAGVSNAYGSHRLVGSWQQDLSKNARFQLQPSVGWDRELADLGTALELDEENIRIGLRGRLTWTPSPHLQLVPGIDMAAFTYDTSTSIAAFASTGGPNATGEDAISEGEAQSTDETGWVYAPDVFLEARWRPLADPDALVIQPGLRMVTVGINDTPMAIAWDPRLAVRKSVWNGGVLKGGTGLHHQAPQDRVLALSGDDALGFERTWSSEVGIEQRFGQLGSISLTGFHRETTDRFVVNSELENLEEDPIFVAQGLGRSNGLEILARKAPVGPLSGWISYTLSRSERLDDPDDPDADWILFDFDQTHILTVTATWRLPYDVIASGRYQYVSGNPTTAYEGGIVDLDAGQFTGVLSGDENGERLPAYSSLDLRLAKLWTFKRWQIEGFVDLLNVVRGENPEGEIWAYDYSTSTYISGLPFIPSVGFDAKVRF